MAKKLWNKDFILLLQGNAVSTVGDLMYSVAIGFWVYQQTGSSGLMGIMSSISMFVTMFCSPFCGSIVDKCSRKWVIVGIDAVQGLLMLGVGVLAWRDALSVPAVLAVALIAALGSVFYSPAISTLMIDIIPREEMVRGQSLHSGIRSLIDLAGSAFSGAMVAFFGVPLIVVINGASNLYSALTELFISVPRTVQQGTKVTARGVLRDSRDAAKTVLTDDCLRIFVPGALVLNLLGAGPLSLLLPFSMEKGFTVDMYGYLISVFTGASVLGVLFLGAVKLSQRVRFFMMAFGFAASVVFFMFGYFAVEFLPMCVFAFLAGLCNAVGNAVFNASLMLALPEQNRSAILGFIQSVCMGGTALSTVIYGFLGDVFPLYLVFAAGSAISLIPMLYVCFHPRVKEFILTNGT